MATFPSELLRFEDAGQKIADEEQPEDQTDEIRHGQSLSQPSA
jgi:hypothetical protein